MENETITFYKTDSINHIRWDDDPNGYLALKLPFNSPELFLQKLVHW